MPKFKYATGVWHSVTANAFDHNDIKLKVTIAFVAV